MLRIKRALIAPPVSFVGVALGAQCDARIDNRH
jgi:hypothetical protein